VCRRPAARTSGVKKFLVAAHDRGVVLGYIRKKMSYARNGEFSFQPVSAALRSKEQEYG